MYLGLSHGDLEFCGDVGTSWFAKLFWALKKWMKEYSKKSNHVCKVKHLRSLFQTAVEGNILECNPVAYLLVDDGE